MMAGGPITECQICMSQRLRSVLMLGYLPPVNALRPMDAPLDQEPWFPAEMLYCTECHLVQLGYAADPRILFPPEYPYTSGTTRILRENFAELYRDAVARMIINPGDLVVDIGSNDGTLLSNFVSAGYRVVGVEPSLTAEIAQERGIPTLMRFFDSECVDLICAKNGRARVVTATNVFAHILDVHRVVEDVARLLESDGVFITESHYLRDLVDTLQYDTIYHEHLRYYSLISLRRLLEAHGFRPFAVKRIPTHGGSIRVYATKADRISHDAAVDLTLAEERAAGLTGEGWIEAFRARVVRSKLELYQMLFALKRRGAKIYGVGAPSRASTLIRYVGLDDGILDCVLEVATSKKVGKFMPGSKIPVLDEAKLYVDQPPFVLVLSWHIAPELCRNLKTRGYRGDFLVPLPMPRVIHNGEVGAA